MPFTDWLLKQAYRDDYIGDLARDASMDTTKPMNGIRVWRQHLKAMRANELAFLALERAWEEYKISTFILFSKNMD
jgi:hypothetical protein